MEDNIAKLTETLAQKKTFEPSANLAGWCISILKTILRKLT